MPRFPAKRGAKPTPSTIKQADLLKRQEEARLAELARIAEEEAKAKREAEIRAELASPEGRLRDLMKWLPNIPLSRKCFTRIERDFSDGVAVAEIMHFYCPDICDIRFVQPYYSTLNKYSNWEYLNQRVFPHLGFKLKSKTIHRILRPWDCHRSDKACGSDFIIYKVLARIQEALGKRDQGFFNYRTETQPPLPQNDDEPDPCKVPKTKIPDKKVHDRFEKTIFSKIEIQIANGRFEEQDEKDKLEKKRREEEEKELNSQNDSYDDEEEEGYYDTYRRVPPNTAGRCDFNRTKQQTYLKANLVRCCTAPCCLYSNMWKGDGYQN